MALQVGSRLGHYDVTALIGEGGMGQVYQATDTKLNRQVALKILPEAFASDPDRLARFQREAQVLASLNHPNIGGIHGLEESDGVRALVLEYIEGPTLADRISQGPIPLDEALPIAKQIAEALEAAHEQGVIHRDLKPANIKVKDDGTVKVLDFGLAKAFQPDASDASQSMSPTISLTAATQMGMVIGTAAYMAPEQAKGKPVDKRADIWAFGAVLFEMLTGKKLFDADDVSEMLASVLVKDPDISSMGAHIPANIQSVVRRCLVKDPKQRLRDIGDVRLAMDGEFETASAAGREEALNRQPAGWRQALPLALGTLVIGSFVTGLVVWSLRPTLPLGSPAHFVVSATPSPAPVVPTAWTELAISADGRTVVYRTVEDGEDGLYVRPVDRLEGELLPGTADAASVFLSPDGTEVGFYSRVDQALKTIRISDGIASTLFPSIDPRGASWGADDTIVFAHDDGGVKRLSRISAAGGEPEILTTPDGVEGHYWPEMLPGGRRVLFTIVRAGSVITGETSQIAVLDLDTGETSVLVPRGTYPRYVSSGHLAYSIGETLWAVPFDADELEVMGDPTPVLEGVFTETSGGANVDISDDGTLVYQRGGAQLNARTLVWVDREGNEEAVPADPLPYDWVRLSPNGLQAVTQVGQLGVSDNADLILYDLVRDTPTPFTFSPGDDALPVWTPDGQQVVFHSFRDGMNHILQKAADGTGEVEAVRTSENIVTPSSISPDGGTLVFMEARSGSDFDIGVLSLEGDGTPEWLLEEPFGERGGNISPDGRRLVYTSTESGQFDIFVRPFPNVNDGRFPIATNGVSATWGPDGRELFYQRLEDGAIMVVPIETEPTFRAGNPSVLFVGPYGRRFNARSFDTIDGQRFLVIKEPAGVDAAARGIIIHQNFHEELKRLFPD
jgi:serine/threonine-protein kinase